MMLCSLLKYEKIMNGKKILFVFNSFQLGGVASSMLNLLREISFRYEIDLLCFSHEGPMKELLPRNVNILPTNKWLSILGDTQRLTMEKSKVMGIIRFLLRGLSMVFGSDFFRRMIISTYGHLNGYDYAISFTHDLNHKIFCGGANRFVAEFTDAPRKITFVHCDFSKYGGNTKIERDYYHRFDRIACCSEGCKRVFDSCIPDLSSRTVVVRNCLDFSRLEQGLTEKVELFDQNCFNVITVGRLSFEKGIDRALKAIATIIKQIDIQFMWYIIGDGLQKDEIQKLIKELGLSKSVKLLGEKKNPYPYMKQADLFFLPSFHECAPMVFEESLYLGVPIMATETISVKEMIIDRNVGYICDNSFEGIKDGLLFVLNHKEIMGDYRESINNMSFNNDLATTQFDGLLTW